MSDFTEEQALKMEKAADHFLVKLEDNIFGVRFNGFKLRDIKTGRVFHEYYPADPYELDYFADHMLDYPFPNEILKGQKHLGTSLNLVVGDKPVKNLVLLERHYIGGKLAANFRFPFPLFIPKYENKSDFLEVLKDILKDFEVKETNNIFVCTYSSGIDYDVCYEETNAYSKKLKICAITSLVKS